MSRVTDMAANTTRLPRRRCSIHSHPRKALSLILRSPKLMEHKVGMAVIIVTAPQSRLVRADGDAWESRSRRPLCGAATGTKKAWMITRSRAFFSEFT